MSSSFVVLPRGRDGRARCDSERVAPVTARRAIADGHGDKSYLAVFEVFKKAAS
ncbi:hypothetical protein [Amycolatopsis tucumanensis]|nr:hypothetical protein [Amycolatopsis tucumanensis]MCF6426065.1 hypothetical protein [Amycolatopsis tucumanensis]